MSNESNGKASVFPDGFGAPITGLLSLLFAMMAGMSVLPALSGSPGDVALPIIFGGASILSFRLRQRYLAAAEND
ncbi:MULTISPECIES: hypothetical protein [Natrialbaceae]|uniref:hypothetical protein n=1 Tax=Natrialbaceae TaxID=1644061 RepID=UPI00207D130D|nr:hypothetical protein [Natronococcus sp. CG52]